MPPSAEQQGPGSAALCTTGLPKAREKGGLGQRRGVASCLQGSPRQASACLPPEVTPIQMGEAKPRRKSWHRQQKEWLPGLDVAAYRKSRASSALGNGKGSAHDSQPLAWPLRR